jgi:leucyl-tRNA synthetase
MLAKKPDDRHQKMEEVVQDLIAIQGGFTPHFAKENWQATSKSEIDAYEKKQQDSKAQDTEKLTKHTNSQQSHIKLSNIATIATVAITSSMAFVAISIYLWQIRDLDKAPTADGKKVVIFEFPKDYSIGEISSLDETRSIQSKIQRTGHCHNAPRGVISLYSPAKTVCAIRSC